MTKTVSVHTDALEAHIVKGRLEAEGIPVYIADEYHISLYWPVSMALGGVKVKVPLSYVEQADSVINNLDIGLYDTSVEVAKIKTEATLCPSCNSKNTKRIDWIWKLAFIPLFFSFFMPIPFSKLANKCNDCSHYWIATVQRPYSLGVIAVVIVLISLLCSFICVLAFYYFCRPYNCGALL